MRVFAWKLTVKVVRSAISMERHFLKVETCFETIRTIVVTVRQNFTLIRSGFGDERLKTISDLAFASAVESSTPATLALMPKRSISSTGYKVARVPQRWLITRCSSASAS